MIILRLCVVVYSTLTRDVPFAFKKEVLYQNTKRIKTLLFMKESILHYIWQQKLFKANALRTTDGEELEIIDVGRLNIDAGPDFFNAKIKIGETIWAGNIEIHLLASDWKKHNHQFDKNYNSVILHVVKIADEIVTRADGAKISQLELSYPESIELNYEKLLNEQKWIPCADKIQFVPDIFIQNWKSALLTERLEQKITAIEHLLDENKQHWEDTFYISLARSYGFNTNGQAFESLAKSLPLSVLAKHKDNLFQIEALLFGQSGLLPKTSNDEYVERLTQEYDFFRNKFSLQAIDGRLWKLLRLRPGSFPHIRIAQFASLIHKSSKLFSHIVEDPQKESLIDLFKTETSEYWKTHYLFAKESDTKIKNIGVQSIYSILINTVVPLLFCYANNKGSQDLKDKSLQLLDVIPAEQNTILTGWKNLGMEAVSAYDSQALIQLKKCYCDDKKCLRCRIGHKVLTVTPNP